MNTHIRRGEQWQPCARCGFMYPMSMLVVQKGLLICTRRHCFDNLMVERRSTTIEQVMNNNGAITEGADTRSEREFFIGQVEEVS